MTKETITLFDPDTMETMEDVPVVATPDKPEMVLVPREPTEKMFLAFVDTLNSDADQSGGTGSFQMAYAAMINAAEKR